MTPKIKKLIDQGRLLPIFGKSGDQYALLGYQRKPGSRKSHLRPYMFPQPIPIPDPTKGAA
jgi:hypothetical protein